MNVKRAEALARNDARAVTTLTQDYLDNVGMSSHEAEVIVTGDHLSPSWRALPGGSEVWRLVEATPDTDRKDALDAYEVYEAYAEVLDEELGKWAGDRGAECLVWHEGDLWVCGEDFDWEGAVM